MATLHILSHSPFTDSRLESCLNVLGPDDAVLLCGDACYALLETAACAAHTGEHRIYALQEDLEARNIQPPPGVTSVDYPVFVELCVHYQKVNSWL